MTLLATLGLSADAIATRKDWIGGSDANAILGGNPERLIRLWREKRSEAAPEDLSDILAVQMGSFTEPFNAAWFEKHTGYGVEGAGVERTTEAFGLPMRATLDGQVFDAFTDECLGVFEAKHVGVRNTDAEIFARYVPQLTHNCLCAGLDRAWLSVFKGNGDWAMFEYDLDPAYADAVVAAERAFWECVQTGEPPAPLPPPPTPKPKGVVEYDMTTSNAWAALAAEYVETILPAQRHEAAKKGLKEIVPDDASKCHGHGVVITRTKAGALRFANTGE